MVGEHEGKHRAGPRAGRGLVERDAPLAVLRQALARAASGLGGTVVLVSGEAGIGKTSLLAAFAGEAAPTARVLAGTCDDLLAPRVFGPFRDMLRDAGLPAAPPPHDRDAYLETLVAATSDPARPAVVLVDDAHWADDASVDVVRYLGRRVGRLRAVLVVAYRTGEAARRPSLARALGALTGPTTERIELAPLSDATVAALAVEAHREPTAVVASVGGNPFFLAEVLATPGDVVPPTVRDAVLARVAGVPARTQDVLRRVALSPEPLEEAFLRATVGPDVARVLEPAEVLGITVVTPHAVAFRHEIARRAVEAATPPSTRTALHRELLGWLAASGAEPARLVHHAAALVDTEALRAHAPVAARQAAAAEAHSETLALCTLALDAVPDLSPEVRSELHRRAAEALSAMNRFGEAREHARRAVRCAERAGVPPHRLADALLVASRTHTMVGSPEDARADLDRALRILAPLGPGPELARAHGMLGNLEALEAHGARAVHWSRLAAGEADALGRRDVAAHARTYLGLGRLELGDVGGLEDLRAAVELARVAGHAEYLCRAAINTATALIWLGRHAEGSPFLDVAEEAAREHGLDHLLFHVQAQRAHVDLVLGRWDAADTCLRSLLATDRDPSAVLVLPLALHGRLLARRGAHDDATALAQRAWEVATRARQVHRLATAGGAVVELAWLDGDRTRLRGAAVGLLALARRSNLPYLHGETLRYLRRAGDDDVRPFPGCPPGFAAGLDGDWAGAAAAWDRAGNVYEAALELTESPDAATAVGGLRRLDGLGAVRTAALVRRRLHERGVVAVPRGPRPAAREHPAGLTARESEVLVLLAEGLTSADVAARLVLSRRTVDNHVAAVLRKVGTSSRRQAVAHARAAGWLEAPPTARLPT